MFFNRNIVLFFLMLCIPLSILVAEETLLEEMEERNESGRGGITRQFEAEIKAGYIFPNEGSLNVTGGWSPVSYSVLSPPAAYGSSGTDRGRDIGSETGWIFGGLIGRYVLTVPMLRGDSGLTEENNLKIIGGLTVNPIADANIEMRTILTVFPFLNLFAFSELGFGWTIGDEINGLAVLARGTGKPEMNPLDGVVYQGGFGGEILFNLAAVLPLYNPWLNILFSASGSFQYQTYSAAGADDAWVYGIADDYSYNCWEFVSEWFLGYKLPVSPLEIFGIAVDTRTALGNTADRSPFSENGWGSDFTETNVNFVTIWPLGEKSLLQVVVMFNNNIEYTSDSAFYKDFRNRESTGNTYWALKGIQFSYKIMF